MDQLELPFDPAELVLRGVADGVVVFFELLASFPWWLWLVVGAALLCGRVVSRPPSPRRRRRKPAW